MTKSLMVRLIDGLQEFLPPHRARPPTEVFDEVVSRRGTEWHGLAKHEAGEITCVAVTVEKPKDDLTSVRELVGGR